MATVERHALSAQAQRLLNEVLQCPLPRHIAIVMDGNGRWAKQLDKDRTYGHRQGVDTARDIVEFSIKHLKLETLTLYAFSTENWNRPRREVDFLMDLMQRFLREQVDRLVKKNVQLRVLGDVAALPESLQTEIQYAIDRSKTNDGLNLNLAVNYGSRQEILKAVQELAARVQGGELSPEAISEQLFEQALYTSGLPDPDLVIRTAEQRLSNFLLWQAAYAEFWTTPTPWPEFSIETLLTAIGDFQKRPRTYGSLNNHA